MFNDDLTYKFSPHARRAQEIDQQVRDIERHHAQYPQTYFSRHQNREHTMLRRTAWIFRNLFSTLFMN